MGGPEEIVFYARGIITTTLCCARFWNHLNFQASTKQYTLWLWSPIKCLLIMPTATKPTPDMVGLAPKTLINKYKSRFLGLRLQWKEKEREDGYQSYHGACTGFSSQGGAKLRAFPCYCIAENTQISPSMTRMYRAPLIGGPQVSWISFLLLLNTSASTCQQHSHNLGPAY